MRISLLAACVAATLFTASSHAADTVLVGQPVPLKGTQAARGQGMAKGLEAAAARFNAAGGVNGHTIKIKSINDSYEPEKTAQITKMLVEDEHAIAIVGSVGTANAQAAMPLCQIAKVPFMASTSGAEVLRNPFSPYVINLRASLRQETEAIVKHLVEENGIKTIACFFQDDGYGKDGLAGLTEALSKRGMKVVAAGSYPRNTIAITEGLKAITAAKPGAVVIVGAYKPAAEFIKAAKEDEATKTTTFATVSGVGVEGLVAELAAAGENVLVSQVTPSPWDTSMPIVREYQEDMKKAGAESDIGYISLEGYLGGRLFAAALAKVEGTPTGEAISAVVFKLGAIDLGGFSLKYGENDNQGSDHVYLTTIHGGKIQPVAAAVANADKPN